MSSQTSDPTITVPFSQMTKRAMMPPSKPLTRSSIFIINPNSSKSMTSALSARIPPSISKDNECYVLSCEAGPPSIDDDATISESYHAALQYIPDETLLSFNAFVVACYSGHPLVPHIRNRLAASKGEGAERFAIGIFEASLFKAMGLLKEGEGFGIVSTGKFWEENLSEEVRKGDVEDINERFLGVTTTGLSAGELHEREEAEVKEKLKGATKELLRKGKVGAVCLGCAGMTGMEKTVREACREEYGQEGEGVRVVDGFLAALEHLASLLPVQ